LLKGVRGCFTASPSSQFQPCTPEPQYPPCPNIPLHPPTQNPRQLFTERLPFRNKEMLIASGARGVLQRVAYLSDPTVSPDYKGTNTAVTWASLALKQ
jgi:hypothetical protein